jgi:Predicted membrane protein
MLKLLWREWIVSKSALLIVVIAFIFSIIYTYYIVTTGQQDEIQRLILLIAFLVTIGVETRPMILDDKDQVFKFLKTLPIKQSKIVAAKFIFINAIFFVFYTLSLLFQIYLNHNFSNVVAFSINIQIFTFSISLILINLFLLGYYVLGAANMQYVMVIGFLIVLICFKYFNYLALFNNPIIIIILAILLSVLFYILSCIKFSKKQN